MHTVRKAVSREVASCCEMVQISSGESTGTADQGFHLQALLLTPQTSMRSLPQMATNTVQLALMVNKIMTSISEIA